MNLEELRKKYDDLKVRMKALNDKSVEGKFTDEDQVAWDAATNELEELRTQINSAETRAKLMEEFQKEDDQSKQSRGRAAGAVAGGQQASGNSSGDRRTQIRSIAQQVFESDEFRAFRERGGTGHASITIPSGFYHAGVDEQASLLMRGGSNLWGRETRALVYTGSFPTGAVEADRVPGILQQQFARPTVRDAFASTPTTSSLITFVRELLGSHTSGAAWVAEPSVHDGSTGLKTQSTLVFDGDEAAVREIATWIPVSENIRDDLPGLQSLIENRLLDFLAQAEDDALINGTGIAPELKGLLAQSGIQVFDDAAAAAANLNDAGSQNEDFNRALYAISLVKAPGLASASFFLIHPTAMQYLMTSTDANRQYYGGGPFVAGTIPRLWGVPIIETDKVATDEFIVGDGRMAEVRDRQQGTIDIGWINDQFVRDMFSVRAKERLAFPVYRSAAFVHGTWALN